MSKVLIKQEHNKSDAEVREIISEVEGMLTSKFGLKTRWQGNAVKFQRSGLDGELSMQPGAVLIKMKLGMMLGMYSRKIQTELEKIVAEKLA